MLDDLLLDDLLSNGLGDDDDRRRLLNRWWLLRCQLIEPPLLAFLPLLDEQLNLASEQFGQHLDIFFHEDAVRVLSEGNNWSADVITTGSKNILKLREGV